MRSVAVRIRQQRQEARALDRLRQHALIAGLGAGDAARHDLAGFGDVLAQRVEVFVIDLGNAFGSETAELLAAEKLGHGISPGSGVPAIARPLLFDATLLDATLCGPNLLG